MAVVPISEDLRRFIAQHIHSVLQLEILLLLRATKTEWTPASLAEELRITEQSAEFRLKDLQLRGLVSNGSAAESYRYDSQVGAEPLVEELAQCYADAKYTVINLIFSEPGDSARSLAEAFRFRKKRDD